jgi:hypothetical protein
MFSCCKEALKYSSCGSRRVNISAAVGARIQEDSQSRMAVEERNFSITVGREGGSREWKFGWGLTLWL